MTLGLTSLALLTDMMTLASVSQYEDHGTHITQRTPSEPDFWFGNSLIFITAEIAPKDQIALFKKTFPEARHVCLQWDKPITDFAPYTEHGFTIDHTDALTLNGDCPVQPLALGLCLGTLNAEADWEQLFDLSLQTAVEDGYTPETHAPYLRRRLATQRRDVTTGRAKWFGVWDNTTLVGSMGVYVNEQFIRFQDVQTRASHRRRGICTALLPHVCSWAKGHSPDALAVIVADRGSAAGRLYQRAGFSLAERSVAAFIPSA